VTCEGNCWRNGTKAQAKQRCNETCTCSLSVRVLSNKRSSVAACGLQSDQEPKVTRFCTSVFPAPSMPGISLVERGIGTRNRSWLEAGFHKADVSAPPPSRCLKRASRERNIGFQVARLRRSAITSSAEAASDGRDNHLELWVSTGTSRREGRCPPSPPTRPAVKALQ